MNKILKSKISNLFPIQSLKVHSREASITFDHKSARIAYIYSPGWGKHGIIFGSHKRCDGLAFALFLLNGHNNSQTSAFWLSDKKRIFWGILRFLMGWIPAAVLHPRLRLKIYPNIPHDYNFPHIKINLAAGFFRNQIPRNPSRQGNAFLMRASDIYNGQLNIRYGKRIMPVVESVQNNQAYYVIILRKFGAAYYISSVNGAHGYQAYPYMRPVGIDTRNGTKKVFASIFQSILGEIGFRVDTRLYGARIAKVEGFSSWFGSAHFADTLFDSDACDIAERLPVRGRKWIVHSGQFRRTPAGLTAQAENNFAANYPEQPSGLIHLIVTTSSLRKPFGICWRILNQNNFLCIFFSNHCASLFIIEEGKWQVIDSKPARVKRFRSNSIQILDCGKTLSIFLNGKRLFNQEFDIQSFMEAAGIGFYLPSNSPKIFFQRLEAHPRSIRIPDQLDLGAPWDPTTGREIVIDRFTGPQFEFNGKVADVGDVKWHKEIGKGCFLLTGKGSLRVNATSHNPNPGRTAYTIQWKLPEFAQLESKILPPGSEHGQSEKGRAGFIFLQDLNNYIIVSTYLDDWKVGKSISSFFFINGEEDIKRAVWTNVGHRIHWGTPYTLRVSFDGRQYLVHLNNEPVLYRSLNDVYPEIGRLSINRVGLVANWEFGDDTGSEFLTFIARGPA